MNMYILFLMFVLCYFCNIDMYIFDKVNVLYFTLADFKMAVLNHTFDNRLNSSIMCTFIQITAARSKTNH